MPFATGLGYSLTIGEGLPDEDPLQIKSAWVRALDVYVVCTSCGVTKSIMS